nr:hypothetical protein [Burkholderia cepacia]
MYPGALVTLNMRELDRLKVIQAVVDTGLKPDPRGSKTQADDTADSPAGRQAAEAWRGGSGIGTPSEARQ